MKKIFLSVVSSMFSQNAGEQITDYFPVKIGNTWTYTNGIEKRNETVFVQNSTKKDIPLYLFITQTVGIGQTSTMYGLENNKIVIVVTRNAFNQYKENKSPFPIELAPANQRWRQDESDDEYYLFRTTKTSIKYDDKSFADCILVEQQIYTSGKLFMTKRSYFAKNVGLVYISLQGDGKEKMIYQKLINCNFIEIKNIDHNKE
jgi:hypothetical protein